MTFPFSKRFCYLWCFVICIVSINVTFYVEEFISETWPLHDFFVYLFIYERRMVFSNIPLFCGSMCWNSFIKTCFKSIKLKIIILRSHLNNTIFDVKHKRFIKKVFIIPTCHNVWFLLFYRMLSLLLRSYYENLTTRFLLWQNFGDFLDCLLILDQCKKFLTYF